MFAAHVRGHRERRNGMKWYVWALIIVGATGGVVTGVSLGRNAYKQYKAKKAAAAATA